MALSFEEIRRLVSDAIAETYPAIPRDGEDPYPGSSRFYVTRIWSDMAFVRKSYWSSESDPSYGFVKYRITENDTPEIALEPIVAAKIQAVAEDNSITISLEAAPIESAQGAIDDLLLEGGKRNSKRDKATINAVLRTLVNLLNADEIDDETIVTINKKISTPTNGTKADARTDLVAVLKNAADKAQEVRKEDEEDSSLQERLVEARDPDAEWLTEEIESVVAGTFDKKNLIIKDHVVLGPISKNGYTYPVTTQQEALPVFEGAKAYLNHPTAKDMGEARNVRDLIGYHKNLRIKGEKTYSDLHLINNRTVQDYVMPVADSAPHLIGSSVVIRGKMKKMKEGLPQIEKIYACRSIDLVSEPATTNGLYESSHKNSGELEDAMELKDLTLDQLKKERSDLVEAILASVEEGKKVAHLETQTVDLQAKLKEADEKIAKLELDIANRDAAEAKRRAEEEIQTLVREAKIPDAVKYEEKDGKKAVKSHFYNLLARCESTDERKALIVDWEESCKGAVAEEKKATTKPISYEQKLGTGQLTEASVDQ